MTNDFSSRVSPSTLSDSPSAVPAVLSSEAYDRLVRKHPGPERLSRYYELIGQPDKKSSGASFFAKLRHILLKRRRLRAN